MQRVPYPSRSLTVHNLNAIGASTERPVDFLDDLRDRFVDGQPMEIDPAGWRALAMATRCCRLRLPCAWTFIGSRTEVIAPAGNCRVVYLNAVPTSAAGCDHDPSLLAEGEHDDGGTHFKFHEDTSRNLICPVDSPACRGRVAEAVSPAGLLSSVKGYGIKVSPRGSVSVKEENQ